MQHSRYSNSPSTVEQRIVIKTNSSSQKKNKKKREKLSINAVTTTELLQTHSDASSTEFKDKKKGGTATVKEHKKLVVIDISDEVDDDEESVTTRPSVTKPKVAMTSPGKRPAIIEVGDVVENVDEIKKKVKFDGKKVKGVVVESTAEKTFTGLTPFKPIENTDSGVTQIVAVDCEMVMTVGNIHELARCSIVNYDGHVLFDKMIYPKGRITNYLTWVSGITPAKLRGARPYDDYKNQIMEILKGKTIVGHSLKNDFEALNYFPQEKTTRDLSHFRRLRDDGKLLSLKKMIANHLNINFQDGQHDSVEDARAAMALYRKFEKQWEEDIKQANYGQVRNMFLNDLKNALA